MWGGGTQRGRNCYKGWRGGGLQAMTSVWNALRFAKRHCSHVMHSTLKAQDGLILIKDNFKHLLCSHKWWGQCLVVWELP